MDSNLKRKLLQYKLEYDHPDMKKSSRAVLILILTFIIGLNIFFVYYTILKSNARGLNWQYDFVMSCLVQLACEIFLFETVEILYIHIFLVNIVKEEIIEISNILMKRDNSKDQNNLNGNNILNLKDLSFINSKNDDDLTLYVDKKFSICKSPMESNKSFEDSSDDFSKTTEDFLNDSITISENSFNFNSNEIQTESVEDYFSSICDNLSDRSEIDEISSHFISDNNISHSTSLKTSISDDKSNRIRSDSVTSLNKLQKSISLSSITNSLLKSKKSTFYQSPEITDNSTANASTDKLTDRNSSNITDALIYYESDQSQKSLLNRIIFYFLYIPFELQRFSLRFGQPFLLSGVIMAFTLIGWIYTLVFFIVLVLLIYIFYKKYYKKD